MSESDESELLRRPPPPFKPAKTLKRERYATTGEFEPWWNAEAFRAARNYEEWFGVSREEIETYMPEALDEDGIPIPTVYTGKKINGITIAETKRSGQTTAIVERLSEPGVETSKRCGSPKADGTPCTRWAMRGATRCYVHGGRLSHTNSQKYAEAALESVRLKLVDLTEDAAEVLQKMLDPTVPDAVRLKAATEVLDRTGVKGALDINVEVSTKQNASALVMERLAQLSARDSDSDSDSEIIDAEVVEDE